MKSLAGDIEDLRGLPVEELRDRYREICGREPRVRHSREWLWKRIAWRLEERRSGGLSEKARRRLEQLIAEIDLPLAERQRTVSGALRRPQRPGDPKPGTELTRRWKGREVRVLSTDEGYEYEGTLYRSLSAVARAVTGSHWNGRLFFGLSKRRREGA